MKKGRSAKAVPPPLALDTCELRRGSPKRLRRVGGALLLGCGLSAVVMGQQPASPPPLPPVWVAVRPIAPPATPLPPEAASATVTKFSFFAYGDTRSGGAPDVPGDGDVIHPEHTRIVDRMIARAHELSSTPFPVRFVLQ